jgi:dTDP-4-amino-4,6-dideoxygalactose transaminase
MLCLENIEEVLNSGYINEGQQVLELQAKLESYLDIENLILLNSCTSAITLALKLCGVGAGDEVLTVAMTCIATNTPIINLGAQPVWVDIEATTGSISPMDLESKITSKTKAIIIVDWAGTPCDLEEIARIGTKYSLKIIQDAAHAFGAKWKGKSIAKWTDFTCYSFQAIKHFTTGDGGALVCKDHSDYLLAKKLKWFGFDRDLVKDKKGNWKGQKWDADIAPNEVGYKFNMNNINAAIGLSNLGNMNEILDKHRENAATYIKNFKNSEVIKLLEVPTGAISSYWVFTILISEQFNKRDKILAKLNENNIAAGLVHLPNHNYSCFQASKTVLKQTDIFSETQISLPCGWWLGKNEIDFISERLMHLTARTVKYV